MIGISTGRGERVAPTNPDYSLFFEVLRQYGRRTEPLDDLLADAALDGCTAILDGEPRRAFDKREADALQRWVAGGGSLLWFASAGFDIADIAPGAEAGGQVRLATLFEEFQIHDTVVTTQRGVTEGRVAFDTELLLDVSPLTAEARTICYDTGCTLNWDGEEEAVTHALEVPSSAAVLYGVEVSGGTVKATVPPWYAPSTHYAMVRFRHGRGAVIASARAGPSATRRSCERTTWPS
jgi:hypothetical protein